jgi:hypothetical protein
LLTRLIKIRISSKRPTYTIATITQMSIDVTVLFNKKKNLFNLCLMENPKHSTSFPETLERSHYLGYLWFWVSSFSTSQSTYLFTGIHAI